MRRVNLLRSTPFRLAMTFGVLFVAAFLVAGAITYHMLNSGLERQLDDTVNEIYSAIASTYAQNDVEDLIAAVNTYSSLRSPDQGVFLLSDANGKRLAGNLALPVMNEGLSSVGAASLGLPDGHSYRVRSGLVGGNRLVVGRSFAEKERLGETLLVSLGWAAGVIVLIAAGGGAFLATRAQRRLDAVARTMIDVSNGELATRIPLHGNGDDIDLVSEKINHALDRLSGLVEGMRQVSADIAHELKTPLNRLKMTLEDAAERTDRGEPVGQQIADACMESDQINATFEALLRISQIEAGARRARFQSVDLADVMSSVTEIYRDVAVDAGQTLRFVSVDGAGMQLMGDRELLIQMFVNLIENAINHSGTGTLIELSLARRDNLLLAGVADNGVGIPTAEHTKVFRRLYRLDKSRTSAGSGLGLSLVKAVADLHSAEVILEDNQPGARVLVRFPALR